MAITVILGKKSANEVMDIVKELREQGLRQGKDFDFAYYPSQYDDTGFNLLEETHAKFTFHTEKYATMFTLKYL
jgi:hypothetical protein